jgi:putative endonuclease
MSYYLYILQSEASGRYYIGQTQDLEARIAYHNANYSKSLKNRGPWKIVHSEAYVTRSEAVRREQQIKSWKDRALIEQLISASR